MSERCSSDLERVLVDHLQPVRAPESLWYRVEAELRAPRPARGIALSRLALVFGLLLVSAVSVGWYLDRPGERPNSLVVQQPRAAEIQRAQPAQGSRQHACVVCHG